jgi:hypothetical protein
MFMGPVSAASHAATPAPRSGPTLAEAELPAKAISASAAGELACCASYSNSGNSCPSRLVPLLGSSFGPLDLDSEAELPAKECLTPFCSSNRTLFPSRVEPFALAEAELPAKAALAEAVLPARASSSDRRFAAPSRAANASHPSAATGAGPDEDAAAALGS